MPLSATIVVTSFDREDSLKKLLLGLNNQSVGPDLYEVLIADDSGQNRLGEHVMRSLQTTYRISTVRTNLPYEVNGVSVARNRGIQHATGEIIISIDDDCFPSFFFVEEHIKAHSRPYPVIVLGHRSADASKLEQDRPVSITEPKAINEMVAGEADMLTFSNFMTGNISFSKQMVTQIGLFDESFAQTGEHGYEDIELGYRMWRKGMPTIFSRNAMIYRPPTEIEKEQHRAATRAVEKASQRLLQRHPLLPMVQQFLKASMEGKRDQAIELGEQVVAKDPHHWPVLVQLGHLHYNQGSYEAAQCYLETALTLNDQNPVIHFHLGQLMFARQSFNESFKYTLQVLEMNSNHTGALYLLALLQSTNAASARTAGNGIPEINIELGGGLFATKLRGEGRDNYINLDIFAAPSVDVVTDLSQSLPLPDGTVSRIFSREVIEHLPYRKLPVLLKSCYRALKSGGQMYLSCPDFEAIMALYHRHCTCVKGSTADPGCPHCQGEALVSSTYWYSNLLGDQNEYDDGGHRDTHKNQLTYPLLSKLLHDAGFIGIQRDKNNPNYEPENRLIKLSVTCSKP